ncbi:hypothetical protein CPLU01_13681 [Colletotrichum plurivorum]|uniref:Uncharacterized protein n=1 Tax=Colletotrichum plurivorum TaxID=2175906 RepID=A0A8H6JQN2_9PEZI|nr:hypothetical protein CPLU01_13681 [Colletotrichum plurivorum]
MRVQSFGSASDASDASDASRRRSRCRKLGVRPNSNKVSKINDTSGKKRAPRVQQNYTETNMAGSSWFANGIALWLHSRLLLELRGRFAAGSA